MYTELMSYRYRFIPTLISHSDAKYMQYGGYLYLNKIKVAFIFNDVFYFSSLTIIKNLT